MSLEEGCRTAVLTCMGVTESDRVTIVSDQKSENIGKTLRAIALEITPMVRYFNLDLYGKRPLDHFPDAVKKAALDSTVTFWTASSKEGELESVRRPFIEAALVGGRHGHMVNITEEVVKNALAVDYGVIEKFTNKLYDRLKDVETIRVTNPQGTDITAKFRDSWKWFPSAGICHNVGHWNNLPDGEVFTAPIEMEGTIVVDGIIGDYLGNKYKHKDLQETPIHIKIENKPRPRVVDIRCENIELMEEMKKYIRQNDCASLIGEFGMGTNIFLEELSDNMLQDEKFPGVHIAFGDPLAEETFADWSCPEHLDNILTHCDVWFDGELIMKDSEYLI